MAQQTAKKAPPDVADLVVTLLIDQDKWDFLEKQGMDTLAIGKLIEKSICLKPMAENGAPILDIETVSLRKYW